MELKWHAYKDYKPKTGTYVWAWNSLSNQKELLNTCSIPDPKYKIWAYALEEDQWQDENRKENSDD